MQVRKRFRGRAVSHRRGIQALEFILAMPVLILFLLGGIQLGLMLTFQHSLNSAAEVAAREMAIGTDEDEIVANVNSVLDVHTLELGQGVALVVHNAQGVLLSRGDNSLIDESTLHIPDNGYVRGQITVSGETAPLPNLLSQYCFNLDARLFTTSSLTIQRDELLQ